MRHSRNPHRNSYLQIISLIRKRCREFLAPIIKEIQDEMWKPDPDHSPFGLASLLTDAPKTAAGTSHIYEIATPQVSKREMDLAWRRMVQRDQLFVARNGCP